MGFGMIYRHTMRWARSGPRNGWPALLDERALILTNQQQMGWIAATCLCSSPSKKKKLVYVPASQGPAHDSSPNGPAAGSIQQRPAKPHTSIERRPLLFSSAPPPLLGMPGGRKRPPLFAGFSPFARSLIFSAAAASSSGPSKPLPDDASTSAAAGTPRQGMLLLLPRPVIERSNYTLITFLAHQTTCRGRRPSARSEPSHPAMRSAAAAKARRRALAPARATTGRSLRRR